LTAQFCIVFTLKEKVKKCHGIKRDYSNLPGKISNKLGNDSQVQLFRRLPFVIDPRT
jgi:hypothetical protein